MTVRHRGGRQASHLRHLCLTQVTTCLLQRSAGNSFQNPPLWWDISVSTLVSFGPRHAANVLGNQRLAAYKGADVFVAPPLQNSARNKTATNKFEGLVEDQEDGPAAKFCFDTM